jgi:hypothetical protein
MFLLLILHFYTILVLLVGFLVVLTIWYREPSVLGFFSSHPSHPLDLGDLEVPGEHLSWISSLPPASFVFKSLAHPYTGSRVAKLVFVYNPSYYSMFGLCGGDGGARHLAWVLSLVLVVKSLTQSSS